MLSPNDDLLKSRANKVAGHKNRDYICGLWHFILLFFCLLKTSWKCWLALVWPSADRRSDCVCC